MVRLLSLGGLLRRLSDCAHGRSGRLLFAGFRIAGTAAFLAYGLGNVSNSIWKGQTWSMTIEESVDGLVYALLTAVTFGWLWPR